MLLGLDLGTGSLKALLLDQAAQVLAEASAAYPVLVPRPGWAESDPEGWWQAAADAVAQLRARLGGALPVGAIGLSGQMHSLVLCGRDAAPLGPAILWADTRSEGQLGAYRRLDPALLGRLGNPLVPGMTGPSLLWLRDHRPDLYAQARAALQPKDWLGLRLTGQPCSDPSDASATLLYDLEADGWAPELLAALGLRPELLPEVRPSGGLRGVLTAAAGRHLGLPAGLPVAVGAGDTAAALLGSGLLAPGEVQLTVGTGAQIVAVKLNPCPDPTLRTHTYRAAQPGCWYGMAAIQNAGLALEFARRLLGLGWDEAYQQAFALEAGAAGLSFLPYVSGERTPHLDPHARGAFAGLGLHHTPGHLMRAAFEGVAFALRAGLEALGQAGLDAPTLRIAGGGALDPRWRQLLADTLARPLHSVEVSSASARGAALLGGLAGGLLDERELPQLAAQATRLVAEPDPASAAVLDGAYARFHDLYPRLHGWGVAAPSAPDLIGGPA